MKIIYPPRPKGNIHPAQLNSLERQNKFVVQRKFNGDRNLVHRSKDGEISIYGRYGRPHGRYKMPPVLRRELSSLNFEPGKEYWLDGELLNNRVAKSVKDVVVLYDVLHAGSYLIGRKLRDRLALLRTICREPATLADPPLALRVSDHVWMAETWAEDFERHFKEFLSSPLIEGLVVKDPAAGLDSFGAKPYDADWQWRCREN